MKKTLLFFTVSVFLVGQPKPINAQKRSDQNLELLLYNIGYGLVVGGIGAVINKHPQQKWQNALLKGAGQGALGGYVMYLGKKMTYPVAYNRNLGYSWGAKLVHGMGVSMVENAGLNQNFWDTWNLHVGFIRFEVDTRNFAFRAKAMPYAMSSVLMASRIGELSWGRTLLTGTPYFKTHQLIFNRFVGYSYWNDMTIDESRPDKYRTVAHEYLHIFQHREYLTLNTWVHPIFEKWRTQSNTFRAFDQYIYPDIPYFGLFYELEGRHKGNCYYKNFYEFEAQRFSTRSFVPVCK